jgi:hypothetical protein
MSRAVTPRSTVVGWDPSIGDVAGLLREAAAASVAEYRALDGTGNGGLPELLAPWGNAGETATEAEAERILDELLDVYDRLLEADLGRDREEVRQSLVYGEPSGSIGKQVWTSIRWSATAGELTLQSGTEATYNPITESIIVSSSGIPEIQLVDVLGSELAHFYQDRLDTSTTENEYLLEGFEEAVSHKAAAELASQRDDPELERFVCRERAEILVQGYYSLCDLEDDPPTKAEMLNLGLTESEFANNKIWPWSWHSAPEYSLLGSVLLVSDDWGVGRPFARVFEPQECHPWKTVVEAIAGAAPQRVLDPTAPFDE